MRLALRHIFIILLCTVAFVPSIATEERIFTVINAANGLADNSAQALICTKTGRIIISTIGNLNFYNGQNFSNIVTRREYQYPLPLYHGAYSLHFDRYHHLWLKNAGGLTCTDLTLEKFVVKPDSVLRQMGCPLPVLDFFVDSLNNVWTLADEGLYGVEQQQTYSVLGDRNLQGVDVFDDMLLTFYDNGEEVGQNLSTGNTVHRTRAYEWDTAKRFANTSSLLRHKDCYFQLRNGDQEAVLLLFDVKQLKWTTLMETPLHMNSMALKGQKLYIATDRGYCIFDIVTHEQDWTHELKLASGEVIKADCDAVLFDRQGGIWIGTKRHGLLYAKPNISPFRAIPIETAEAQEYVNKMEELEQTITEFQGMNANCIFTDSRGWSWIGTTTGLYMYKAPHAEPKVFTRKSGFYNDVIHSVVEDADHNVWATTSAGLSFIRFENDEPVFINSFNTVDNIPSESFVNSKAMLLPDSQVVIQMTDHVLIFNPGKFTVNTPHPYKLYPKLSRLMVNGTNVQANVPVDGTIVIDRAISRAEVINLQSNHTTVMLLFTPLNYFRPLQSYYHVRIIGQGDELWHTYSSFSSDMVDSRGMLHLPIFGLAPGRYTIQVQASMFPDMWEGDPYEWEIVVNQSWWQAKGMYYLCAIIVLLLIIINIILYIKNTRMRERRNHEEGDIISKICVFVERAESFENEKLAPKPDEYGKAAEKLAPEFIDIMQKLIPYVRESRRDMLSMHKLGEVADVDIVKLYEIVTTNIYKSPRDMIRKLRLQKAAELLATTDKTIEQISDECGFYTPNYFMGNFFHEYKQTPREYREERK